MVEVELNLVDIQAYKKLISINLSDIEDFISTNSLRNLRPEHDLRFHREFDVDLEGDFLEFLDNSSLDITNLSLASDEVFELENCKLALLMAKWCSIAQWSCWDARLFLYIEPYIDSKISNTDEFLNPLVWSNLSQYLSNTDRESYVESVIIDWMSRRESLGETMEPNEDPRILPTMESHRSLSESLFILLDKLKSEDYVLLVGRDFLPANEWYLGKYKILETLGVTNV